MNFFLYRGCFINMVWCGIPAPPKSGFRAP